MRIPGAGVRHGVGVPKERHCLPPSTALSASSLSCPGPQHDQRLLPEGSTGASLRRACLKCHALRIPRGILPPAGEHRAERLQAGILSWRLRQQEGQEPHLLLFMRGIDQQEADDLVIIALQDKNPEASGRIRLFLTKTPALELKEWVTTDAQGLDTRIEISSLNKTEDIDPGLFKIISPTLIKPQ